MNNTIDYHDEMTGKQFEEWFKNKLLPIVLSPWIMPHIIQGLKKRNQKIGPSPIGTSFDSNDTKS